MNRLKLVCSDIQGTLLNDTHDITMETKNSVNMLDERGIPFILVSARMPSAVEPLQNVLEINTPMICYSGALVLDTLPKQGERTIIANQYIPDGQTRNIYKKIKRNFRQTAVSFYSYDQWIVDNQHDQSIKTEQNITNVIPVEKNIDEYFNSDLNVHKILCIGNENEISDIEVLLNKEYETLSIYKSKDTYLEIMAPDVSKSNAMHHLAAYFNVRLDDMMAIGDNFNDLDMLVSAGVGVAMSNAPEVIKQSADDVTLSNNENGLAVALDKYFG